MIVNKNLYECFAMQDTLGDTLRPGGFETTKRAIEFCKFKTGDILLDLGCGKGATIKYLYDNYKIKAKGIDISENLIKEAKKINKDKEIIVSPGESMPFGNEFFDCVLAECTLSLMELQNTVDEVYRVLKPKGYFVISDVYINTPDYLEELKSYTVNTCLRNPHNLNKLKNLLQDKGFKILITEKHDEYLKQLIIKMIFKYGSMESFWNIGGCSCLEGRKFQDTLKKCKLGYFLMIVNKGDRNVK